MKIELMRENMLPILLSHGVRHAGLFGSAARGEDSPESDIDLLIEVDDQKSLLDLAGLKIDLEDRLRRSIDLVEYDTIHPLLKKQILGEQMTIL